MHLKKKALFTSIIIGFTLLLCGIILITPITAAHAESAVLLSGTDSVYTPASVKAESTSNLTFNLINNGQEYKVSALNRSLTEAIIPSYYNGLPVTEISDNGFLACSSLQKVFVPNTVKRVGNNAFMNCMSLKKVIGMSSVESFGNSAFSMCSSLENLILPPCVKNLGTYMIRNINNPVYARATAEEMAAINPNWNFDGNIIHGNSIVYQPYINAEGITGYEIAPYQNLAESTEPLVIYSWCYQNKDDDIGAPLLNIGKYAFQFFKVPSITIKHPENSNLSHSINIESYAFVGVDASNIDIEVDITLNDAEFESGMAEGLFTSCTIKSITLPDSLNVIPSYTFSYCDNLNAIKNSNTNIETNHLSDKILRIEPYAFMNSNALSNLYIENTIEYIGDNAFSNWGAKKDSYQNIYINVIDVSENWSNSWNAGVFTEYCNIEFTGATEYTVNFITAQNGVVNPIGGSSKVVLPKSTLNDIADIPKPTSTSHDFTGIWYTTEQCTPGTEFAFDKPIKQNLNLYAGWQIKKFDITFTDNKYFDYFELGGGQLSGETQTFEYGQTFQFYIVMNNGYENPTITFDGKVLIPSTGSKIYAITVTKDANFEVNANLIAYTLTYNNLRDGINPNTVTTYTVESAAIYLENPEWIAYNNGTWDITSIPSGSYGDKTITAIWSNPAIFNITYENLRGGTNPNTINTYTIESATINFVSPEWEAYDGRTWDITSIPNDSWGDKTITAVWSNPVTYTITYTNLRSGVNPNTITFYTVESETIDFEAPEWEAYNGRTWDITEIPAGSWGNKTITALWSDPVDFEITYLNLQGGINSPLNPTKFNIDTPTIVFANPTWEAYINGSWDALNISKGSWGDKTITAIWSNPRTFTITYQNLQGGTHTNTVTSYRIDSNTIIFQNPTWEAYNNGTWEITSIPKGSWGDKTITAVWSSPKKFNIKYENLQGGTHTNNLTSYTVESDTITFQNPTWAAYNNGTWNITNIPKGSWGDKRIIALWSNPVTFKITYNGVRGGINPSTNPKTYNIETAEIMFAKPLWEAYNNGTWDITGIPTGSWGDKTISAIWSNPIEFSIIYNGLENGTNPSYNSTHYNVETETIYFAGATRPGYPVCSWNINSIPKGSWGDKTITAVWSKPYEYIISYNNLLDGQNPNTRFKYTVEDYVTFTNPTRANYDGTWDITSIPKGSTGDKTITAKWTAHTYTITFYYQLYHRQSNDYVIAKEFSVTVGWDAGYTITVPETNTAPGWDVQNFERIIVKGSYNIFESDLSNKYYSINGRTLTMYSTNVDLIGTNPYVLVYYNSSSCIAENSLITLADGSQKPVEQLTTDDMLLVWNLKTGKFDTAPILFIDSDQRAEYEVINLYFSDGTSVKVISEHGFWDFNLNQYVFMRNDAAKYIGHWFNKQTSDVNGNMSWIKVRLDSVEITEEMTTAWSPVTYKHLCYYVNGMLSMPGATTGLINIFEVNPDTMKIDEAQYQADIEQYGLFTYEEFAAILPVPKEIFDAFGGKYFKVAMGKGLLDWETIEALANRYAKYF